MPTTNEIVAAFQAVKDLDIPEPYRLAAFKELMRAEAAAGDTSPVGSAAAAKNSSDEPTAIDRLAAAFGASATDIAALFDMSSGEPVLAVHTSRLPRTNSEATKEFAVVVSRAREVLDLETTDKEVRAALEQHGRYDRSNFSKQMAAIEPALLAYHKGSKKISMRIPGREEASRIVARYLGGS